MINPAGVSTNEIYQSGGFKPPYERSNDQLFSQSTLFIVFYQQKVNKNKMFQQITVSTNKIYQLDFLKVCFKLLYEKSNDWILLQSTLFTVFYH